MNLQKEIQKNFCKIINNRNLWIVIFGLQLLLEYLLFKEYACRESINKIPRNMDQTTYMLVTYRTYFRWLEGDYADALAEILFHSNTSAAPAFNAVLLFLFGYSRYSLLLFNFFGLIIAQSGGSLLVYQHTKRRSLACIYNGMILMLGTHFIYAGDLLDYRMDYVAACLFTLFILAWGIALATDNRIYFAIAAFVSGGVIFVRFNTVVYVVLIVVISEIIKLLFRSSNFKKSFLNIVCFGVICIVGGGWSVLTNIKNFLSYYMRFHLGNAKTIWEYQDNILGQVLFYPKALVSMHLGKGLTFLGILAILMIIINCFVRKCKMYKGCKVAVISLSAALIIQMAILTLDQVKINTTASIMAGVWISITITLFYEFWKHNSNHIMEVVFAVFAVFVLIAGGINYAKGTTAEHYGNYDRNIDSIYKAVDEYVKKTRQDTYMCIMDMDETLDLMRVPNFMIYEYENRKREINFEFPSQSYNMSVGNGFGIDEVLADIDKCDLVWITRDGLGIMIQGFTTNSSWVNARPYIWEKLEGSSEFIKLIETDIDGYPVAVFGRKTEDIF